MRVDIWSDVVCPWCYIGKRRLESALRDFPHADHVSVAWHAFELDPGAPREREGDLDDHLAHKYGVTAAQAEQMHAGMAGVAAAEGLTVNFDKARPGNTFNAHRLIHLGGELGLQDAVKERLFRAYLTDGDPIGAVETLQRAGEAAGLPAGEVSALLAGHRFADEVKADERAAHELGITAVPFFVVDGRFGVSGAQPAELLRTVLERAWASRSPIQMEGARR